VSGERGLTNRQGHPVYDNQNTRSVGERGPLVLEDYQFLEKITHFDRERIPGARGALRAAPPPTAGSRPTAPPGPT
jgi:catalase